MLDIVLQSIWLILPAYIANGSAVVFGGGTPIDFNKKWKGKEIFGRGKTWRGFTGGCLAGMAAGVIMNAFPYYGTMPLIVIFSLSCGALLGDLAESFLKRRVGIERGKMLPLLDQIDFVLGALIFTYVICIMVCGESNWFTEHVSMVHIACILIITPLIHLATNIMAYLLKLKDVPW